MVLLHFDCNIDYSKLLIMLYTHFTQFTWFNSVQLEHYRNQFKSNLDQLEDNPYITWNSV